ncbi:MAG: zf-HC2 domain-containing protein [Clostridia bacterium]|nr:zf-HC2 domain-containing protein [Clostridia bacterium]
MSELTCGVVTDLLPSYAEGLTNEETSGLVEAHLADCPACREMLAAMREDAPQKELTEPEHAEIEFLKKNRRRNRGVLIGSIAAALVLALGLMAVKFFVIGTETAEDGILIRLEIDGRELRAECSAQNENRVVSSLEFTESDGVVDIRTRTAVRSPLYKDVVTKTYTAGADIEKVTLNNDTVLREAGKDVKISEELKQRIRDSWAHYNVLTPMERMVLSTMPGYCSAWLETWEEATALLGFEPWNPFEDDERFIKMNFTGADALFPNDRLSHAALNFSGSEDGEPAYIDFSAGYSLNGVRVVWSLNPLTAADIQLVTTVHNSVDVVDPSSFPFGDVTTSYVKPGRTIYYTRNSGDGYESVNLIFRLRFMQYTVRLTALEESGASLDDAFGIVKEIVENGIMND